MPVCHDQGEGLEWNIEGDLNPTPYDSPSVPQLEAEINHLVYNLYNLSPEEIKLLEISPNKNRNRFKELIKREVCS
jgi:hypothetical protein